MTDYQKLHDGISKAAWGYLFIYFDINIGTVSILPSFIGYILFLSAIEYLKDEERDLSLLKPLGIILVLWHIAKWLFSWFGAEADGALQVADVLICLVNLYFHFQLLTNMASIASKYQPEGFELDKKLLRYRTVQTVMLTAINFLTYLSFWLTEIAQYVSIFMVIVYIIAGICLMKALFDLKKCLPTNTEPA